MTFEELVDLVSRVEYKDGYILFYEKLGGSVRLFYRFQRPDTFTGEWGFGQSGTAHVDLATTTHGDVVRTIFGLLKNLEEHECREAFMVDGSRVFGPHIELEALVEAGRHVQGH